MLSRRKVETKWQYERRTGQKIEQVATDVFCGGFEANEQSHQSSQGSTNSVDPRPELASRKSHRCGRVQLYRQFEVDLSSRSQLEGELPRRQGRKVGFNPVVDCLDEHAERKPRSTNRYRAFIRHELQKRTNEGAKAVVATVDEGSDMGMFCCYSPTECKVARKQGAETKPVQRTNGPGMSRNEEKELWNQALEKRREAISTHTTPLPNIDQIEVVPVNPTFQMRGATTYAEMERIGMVFAPSERPKSPVVPPNVPRRKQGNETAVRDWQERMDSSTVTKKIANRHLKSLGEASEVAMPTCFAQKEWSSGVAVETSSQLNARSDPVLTFRQEIKSESSDESDVYSRSNDRHSCFQRDRYDIHEAAERRDISSPFLDEEPSQQIVDTYTSEDCQFIGSNLNGYSMVDRGTRCVNEVNSLTPLPLEYNATSWHAPSSPRRHYPQAKVIGHPRGSRNNVGAVLYDDSQDPWASNSRDVLRKYHATAMRERHHYSDVTPPQQRPYHRGGDFDWRAHSTTQPGLMNATNQHCARSKSPVRLYNDPPELRRMDGSLVKRHSSPIQDQNPLHPFEGDALAAQPIMFAGRLWYLQLVSPSDYVGQIGNEMKYNGRV
jgi:hypothetical protein